MEYFYKGVSGYIYHCEGDFAINPDTHVPTCATANCVVPVTDCEFIENVYEQILSYAEQEKFIYEHYENLPQWRIDVIRGQITRFIKRNDLLNDTSNPSVNFIREKFPQYWAEAQALNVHGLFCKHPREE